MSTAGETVPMDVETHVESTTSKVDDATMEEDEEDFSELQQQYDEATKQLSLDASSAPHYDAIGTSLLSIIGNMNYVGPYATQLKERAVYTLIRLYCVTQQVPRITTFLSDNENFLGTISKAKTAKLVRHVLDIVTSPRISLTPATPSTKAAPEVSVPVAAQEEVTRSILEWCVQQKRSFLRQRVESKLAYILYMQGRYQDALRMVDTLLQELKQLDDKQLLVEIHLLESQLYFSIRNISKSKAALTASRTAANAIYVSPAQQAALDSQSGTIHTEEADYGTAHSYFLEAFEQLDAMNDSTAALKALKYMMLCKILDGLKIVLAPKSADMKSSANVATTTSAMLSGKQAVKYGGKDLDAMQAIAKAVANRNLKELHGVFEEYKEQLSSDILIQHHIQILQEQLLESNLLRIVEPYSCVELDFVAQKIELPVPQTERKLSQMILDGTLNGILDQGKGQLIIYETDAALGKESVTAKALQVIHNMDGVVTSLFERSKELRTVAL
jgi:26S proteasome regulatory subunit N6